MRISLSWVKKYVSTSLSAEEIAEILTQTGLEVETVEKFQSIKGELKGLIVGEVLTCEPHPNADKLKITTVEVGDEDPLHIVCGAPNIQQGQKVIVARVGTTLFPENGEPFVIKKSKIRGEMSFGMICAQDEIGVGQSHDGVIVLSDEYEAGTPAAKVFDVFVDDVVEIGITPNRTDALSHIGVARDLAAVLEKSIILPKQQQIKLSSTLHQEAVVVKVHDFNACPRFTGATVKNIRVESSPEWLKNYLLAIGIRPINNIVDLSNYVMMEWGIPLHVYDQDAILDNGLEVGFLPEGTSFITLDEKERKLSKEDLMIYSGKDEGMCLAGILGGAKSGVVNETKNIFIESAYWNPERIRKSSTRHKLKTDASFRFERGVDPNACLISLERFIGLLKELCPSLEVVHAFDIYPNPIQPVSINLTWKKLNRLIGIEIHKSKVLDILKFLDFDIKANDGEILVIEAPTYRTDVTRDVDVIEEVLRIYGFDNIPLSETLGASYVASFPKVYESQIRYEKTLEIAASGWIEISTNSLENPKYSEYAYWLDKEKQVKVINAKSEELSVMRQTMLFSGLSVIARNVSHKQKDLKLFEFGKVYEKLDTHNYKETKYLTFYLTGNKTGEHWSDGKVEKYSFYDLKEIIYNQVLNTLNLEELTEKADLSEAAQKESLFQYQLHVLDALDHVICSLGEVQSSLLSHFGIQQPVFYAEVDWTLFLSKISSKKTFQSIPKYPEVTRDLSLVIPKSIVYQDVLNLLDKQKKNIVKNIQVFDNHQGKGLEVDQKAYALRFTLQDTSKTLNEKQINKTMNALMKLFEDTLGATIRQ